MNIDDLVDLTKAVKFQDYYFRVTERGDHYVVHAEYPEIDISTGMPSTQTTRKWFVSRFVSKSEFVQTLFKLCLTSMEHRTREDFKYKGKRVFGPHFDVDALHKICEERRFDYRLPALQDGAI